MSLHLSRASASKKLVLISTLVLALALFLAAGPLALAAGPWYVSPSGNDTNDCLSSATACLTIQAAVGKASPGDTINVAAGTYAAGANLNKPVTLKGAQAGVDARDGRPSASESVITAGGLGTFTLNAVGITFDGFKFSNMAQRTIDTYFDADNFTMRNCILQGTQANDSGGAIQFGGPDTLHANGLLFERNLAQVDGGPLLYMGHAMDNGTIRNNLVNGGTFTFGPFGARTGWIIEGNEFNGNVAGHGPYWGFGFNANLGDVIIRNNTVQQMQVGIGQISVVNGSITGNTFDDNSYAAFQLWGGEWGSVVSSNVLIENNLIKYNGEVPSDATFATAAHGIRLRPAPDASTIHMHKNAFINLGVGAPGLAWAIRQNGTGTADAENNWWNTTDGAVIATMIGQGAADYDPWIVAYADDPSKAGQPGFWPLPLCTTDCYVNDAAGSDANTGTSALPFKTIQKGVDIVAANGTVHVAAGTYPENVNVNKRVTLIGAGSGATGSVISATGGSGGVVQLSASGASASQPIQLRSLRIQPTGKAGISVGQMSGATGTNVSFVELYDVQVIGTNTNPCTEQERGLFVDSTSSLTNLKVINSAFNNLAYGWYFMKQVSADTSTVQYVDVRNTTFNHNNLKGIYAEKLEDATFKNVTADQNGYDTSIPGSLCPYFAPWMSGFDINLKAGAYQNLTFSNNTITNNGLGGAKEGVGITVKARDDGGYGANPATLSNVSIDSSLISGNERGIRIGEPGKSNAGPTGVTVHNACITGNVKTYSGSDGSAYGGLVNASLATVDATNNWWGNASGPAPTGTGDAAVAAPGLVTVSPWNTVGCPLPELSAKTGDALFCVGEQTTVTLDLARIAGLYGYQFEVSYNKDMASAVGAFVDTFFNTTVNAFSDPGWRANCTAMPGTCKFSVVKTDPGAPVSGSGTLAQIVFTGVAPGAFDVTVGSDATVTDRDGELLYRILAAPLPMTVCGSTTVSGKITLQGRSAGNVDPGTVTLTDLGGNFPGPFNASFGNDGLFSLSVPVMPLGSSYQMDAAHPLYLTNRKTPVALSYGVPLAGQNTRLWGGDANNNGEVKIGDLSCIGSSFGKTPPGDCSGGSADINADGKVNVQDLAIAGGNFDKFSPLAW
jgi:hypothetical protein